MTDGTLKDLKKVYENSIKPLENIYKYKELSNRHFGDPEIFNKPLIVLMGPWSGGKSSTLNYLLGTEYTKNAFKSGNLLNKYLSYNGSSSMHDVSIFLTPSPLSCTNRSLYKAWRCLSFMVYL